MPPWWRGRVVRQRTANPFTSVQFRPPPFYLKGVVIKSFFSCCAVIACNLYKRYYFLSMLTLSLFVGGGLFYYFPRWMSGESSVSPVTMYCLSRRDTKVCTRRFLDGKKLHDKNIKEVVFTRCDCRKTHLFSIEVSDSDFRESDFRRAVFNKVSFLNTNLFKSSFYGAILKDVVFDNSQLGGVVFNFATFQNVYFKNVDLSSALFIGASFENVYYAKDVKLPFSEEKANQMGLRLK